MTDRIGDAAGTSSPLSHLSAGGRRALFAIGALSVAKAIALILVAEAVARGVTGAIALDDSWRGAIWLGVAGALLRAGSSWAIDTVAVRTSSEAKRELREGVLRRIAAQGGSDLNLRTGETSALVTVGLQSLDLWYSAYLPALVGSVVLPAFLIGWILFADWISALILILTLPLVPIFMALIGQHTRSAVERAANGLARLSNLLVELASGLPVLVGLGRSSEQVRSLREIADAYRRSTMATLRVAFLSSMALELISTISVAVVAVFIGVRLVHGDMDLQTGLMVLVLAPECYLPLRAVGAAHHSSEEGVDAMRRAEELPQRHLADVPRRNSADLEPGAVRVVRLTVRFSGREISILDDASFEAKQGQVVLLQGESGSGKSTLIRAMAGQLGNSSGPDPVVTVTGDVFGIAPESLALAAQHPATFAETVLDEIRLHAPSLSVDQVARAMSQVDASHLAARHPAELSPGELRRVALARAVARVDAGATVLMLDEPTAHLDDDHAVQVVNLAARLKGRVTIILATHDWRLQSLADVIVPVGNASSPILATRGQPPVTKRDGAEAVTPPNVVTLPPDRTGSMRDLGRLLRPYWRGMTMATVVGALASLFAVALISVSGWLIVRASEQPPILLLLTAIVGVRFFGVGRAVFRYLERIWVHDVVFRMMSELRVQVWQRLSDMGPAMARELRGERVFDRLIGDVDRLRELVPRVVLPPLAALLTAVVAIIVLSLILPMASIALILVTLVSIGGGWLLVRLADARSQTLAISLRSELARQVVAFVGAAPDLAAHGAGSRVLDRISRLDAETSRAERRSAWAAGLAGATVILGCLGATLALIWLSAGAVRAGQISAAEVAVLVLTPMALIDPFTNGVAAMQQWPALQTALGRFPSTDVVSASVEGDRRELQSGIERLETDDISARWPTAQRPVFTGVSSKVERGRWLSLTGPSGSGKTTYLSVLMATLRPQSGRYEIDGVDSLRFTADSIRKRIAWCPQEAHIFDSTLRGNLLLARPKSDMPNDAEMIAALDRVGLGLWFCSLPDGLETPVGPRGTHLSGGQRQRVAVARTLLTNADVVLLDEPTAHLDRAGASSMMSDLRFALHDKAVVLVTHHLDDVRSPDSQLNLGR